MKMVYPDPADILNFRLTIEPDEGELLQCTREHAVAVVNCDV